MPIITAADCPSHELLEEYASGSLAEEAADTLMEHLDSCDACQRRVDELMAGADSLMGALRLPPDPNQETRELPSADRLISQAKLLAPARSTDTSLNGLGKTAHQLEPKPKPAVNASIATFLATLTRSKLMTREDVDALADANLPNDAREFAKELVATKKLTSFQATALLRGVSRGLVLGNYVILDKLGRGGMGHVYTARHRNMGRIVCIKTLPSAATQNPEMLERFRREARAVAALNHPNIVVGHDASETDGIHFLVMEYIEGSDLAKRVKESPFPVNEALDITLQTAKALAYAHRQGIIHRDIKPHNLLLDDSGNVKILDMGIARFDSILGENSDAVQATMTNTGVVMGTVDFMSPEQALNTRKADARSDVYSLGCTLHYILTRKPLFPGETLMEKLLAHRESPIPRLADEVPDLPAGLDAVFRKMVAKDPNDRYANMDELVVDLEAVQAGERPKAQSRGPASLMKSKWKLAAAVATTAVILLAIFIPGWLNQPVIDGDNVANASDSGGSTETAPAIVGNPATAFNGGPGRFVLMVPFASYDPSSLAALQTELSTRGAEVVVLSTQHGEATASDGSGTIPVDVTLDEFEFDADEFDGILVAGGDVLHEFGHKNATNLPRVTELFRQCLSEVRVIATIDSGYETIFDCGLFDPSSPDQLGCCTVFTSEGLPGRAVKLHDSQFTPELVNLVYHQLDRRYTLAEGGPGRALVVVPQTGYNAQTFQLTTAALARAGVEFDIAAEDAGMARSTGRGGVIPVDLALHSVTADDYDALIFCDGNPFGSQADSEQCREFTCGLVENLMDRSSVVAGIGSGWEQLKSTYSCDGNCELTWMENGFEIANPNDDREGHAVGVSEIATPESADAFVALIFGNLLNS